MRTITRTASLSSALFAFALACGPVLAQTYDASADFDPNSNPSTVNGGTFSYGFENTLGTGFILFTNTTAGQPYSDANVKGWTNAAGNPLVIQNTSNSPQTLPSTGITLQPKQIDLNPSFTGQFAVLRFTAPSSGTYALNSLFTGIDNGAGTTTDVHVLLNNVQVFGGEVTGQGATQSYASAAQALTAGSTLDFVVGFGTDGTGGADSTALAATITKQAVASTPEPGSIALLTGVGLSGGLFLKRRKRAAR
jgi:hypothetical protein